MAPSSRDRISVDLRGLKAALVERSRARGLTPSDFVRGELAEALGPADPLAAKAPSRDSSFASYRVRLSLRLSQADALAVRTAAREAGLPCGAYLAGLASGVAALAHGADASGALSSTRSDFAARDA